MDEMTETIMTATEVVDDALVKSFTAFQDMLANTGLFRLDNLHLNIMHDIGTVTFPMCCQHMIDTVLEETGVLADVNILYSYKTQDGSSHRLIAYSMPYRDEMYIISMESLQYGIVEEMSATFFDSLDVMLDWLRDCLLTIQQKEKQIAMKECQSMADLYKNFM